MFCAEAPLTTAQPCADAYPVQQGPLVPRWDYPIRVNYVCQEQILRQDPLHARLALLVLSLQRVLSAQNVWPEHLAQNQDLNSALIVLKVLFLRTQEWQHVSNVEIWRLVINCGLLVANHAQN